MAVNGVEKVDVQQATIKADVKGVSQPKEEESWFSSFSDCKKSFYGRTKQAMLERSEKGYIKSCIDACNDRIKILDEHIEKHPVASYFDFTRLDRISQKLKLEKFKKMENISKAVDYYKTLDVEN